MAFQTSVAKNIGFGVVGEIALDGPLRVQPAKLTSASAANNVVGRAFTASAGGSASFEASGNPNPVTAAAGGTDPFAGILGFPKVYPLTGTTAGGTLAATLTLPNDTLVELVQETAGMVVALGAAASVGDWLYYTNATGVLTTAAPGTANAPADSTRVPGGRVERYDGAAAGLAVVSFNSNIDAQEVA